MKDGMAEFDLEKSTKLDSVLKHWYSDTDDWDDCPEFAMKIYCGTCEGCPLSRYNH